jgi:5'-nucleotidase/UDP-sugar diphosphatase
LGFDADRGLARAVRGIHVIVGGHSHTVLPKPASEGDTLIVQAGCNGLYLGVLEMEFDPSTGKVSHSDALSSLREVVAGPASPKDENVAGIVERYNSRISGEFSKVVGETAVDLIRQPYAESNVGNLVADAMRESAGTEIAFQNGGGIRADISKGPVNLEEIYTLLPFDNVLVTMDLKGAQLKQLLERNALLEVRILQVSGMEIEYDLNRPPGERLLKVYVGKEPLDPLRVYTVTTNDFLAAGGDRFVTFKEGANFRTGEDLRTAVTSYFQRHSPVNPSVHNRIVFSK